MGHSLVMVTMDDQLIGAVELEPTIRPEAKDVIEQLRQRNLDFYIISGDQEGPTQALAQKLGIDNYFANTLPENKAKLVEQLQQEGRAVCFVGDGINDSIALKKANVDFVARLHHSGHGYGPDRADGYHAGTVAFALRPGARDGQQLEVDPRPGGHPWGGNLGLRLSVPLGILGATLVFEASLWAGSPMPCVLCSNTAKTMRTPQRQRSIDGSFTT
ncbi:MAG: HAD-IC family P-type ATPase [Caldilineaceae bacterium]